VDIRSERASYSVESSSWIDGLLGCFHLIVTGSRPAIFSYKVNSACPSVSDSAIVTLLVGLSLEGSIAGLGFAGQSLFLPLKMTKPACTQQCPVPNSARPSVSDLKHIVHTSDNDKPLQCHKISLT